MKFSNHDLIKLKTIKVLTKSWITWKLKITFLSSGIKEDQFFTL